MNRQLLGAAQKKRKNFVFFFLTFIQSLNSDYIYNIIARNVGDSPGNFFRHSIASIAIS